MRERGIIPRTVAAIAKARAAGVPVGFVRVGFSPDYRECPSTSAIFSGAKQHGRVQQLGTGGTEVHADLAPQPGDFDIVKHRVSPFYGSDLELILRANRIERIFLSCVSTVAVVQGTVRDAHDRDYASAPGTRGLLRLGDRRRPRRGDPRPGAFRGLRLFGARWNSAGDRPSGLGTPDTAPRRESRWRSPPRARE